MRLLCAATLLFAPGCAFVNLGPGQAAVVVDSSGGIRTEREGTFIQWPFDQVDTFDLRDQALTLDLDGISADGAREISRASLVTYEVPPQELTLLDQEVGQDYVRIIIAPVVRSAVRRVLAELRGDQLTTGRIQRAEQEATVLAAASLRPYHIVLEGLDFRTVAVVSNEVYAMVLNTGKWEQQALAMPTHVKVAEQRAKELVIQANSVAATNRKVDPTLSTEVLAHQANQAWSDLLASPSTHAVLADQPILTEEVP